MNNKAHLRPKDFDSNGDIIPMSWKEERPQGEWITQEGYDGDEYYECSVCKDAFVLMAGTPKENNYNYCPNCGADMRKGYIDGSPGADWKGWSNNNDVL